MATDDVSAWVEAVREEQRRKEAATDSRDELVEALQHACATAVRLRGTAYYDSAHKRINEILDELVGL